MTKQTQVINMDRNNYHTYLFVGLCWFIPIALLSMTIGPIQWIVHWADTFHWNANYRMYSFFVSIFILTLLIVFLTQTTSRFLMNVEHFNASFHKGVWLFLTLSCIASLGWILINPELFTAIGQTIASTIL